MNNDVAVVKALTLGKWGFDLELPPLAISKVSGVSSGPFLAAVQSRNYNLARTIVYIATVQHVDYVADKDNSSDNLGVDVCGLLVDDVHSIEAVKNLRTQVKATKSAKQIVLESNVCVSAGKKKDMEMLKFAIEIESCFGVEQSDVDRHTRHAWALVENGDWPHGFEEYVRATGAPFNHIVVRGELKVRIRLGKPHQVSPLLYSARSGNLDMVRFFLEKERVMSAYKGFSESSQFHIRKASIKQSETAFLAAVEKWIDRQGEHLTALKL
jgi:hypothetical protein